VNELVSQPAKHGRSLVGFYIALSVVAVLVGVGVYLYQPLRLRYAIHKVRSTSYPMFPSWHQRIVADQWLMICVEGAREGDQQAMETVIDHVGIREPPSLGSAALGIRAGPDITYLAAVSQPKRFFDALSERDNEQVLRVLGSLANSTQTSFWVVDCLSGEKPTSVGRLVQTLGKCAGGGKPEDRHVTQTALDFARRRFVKELAEAGDAKAEVPKP